MHGAATDAAPRATSALGSAMRALSFQPAEPAKSRLTSMFR
jgi:hypothetical protein